MKVMFKEKESLCLSHLNVRVCASKKEMRLILIYGLGETPMMLLTNKKIESKKDVIRVVRLYLSRWRIEDYIKFKKEDLGLEKFRVRNLNSINNLNQL